MNHRYLTVLFSAFAVASIFPGLVGAQTSDTSAPRTPWGQPDLQGIWDFRTITPLERPEGQAEFLTIEEAANIEQATVNRNEELLTRGARRTESTSSVDQGEEGAPGFYNNFWLDGGTTIDGTRRTSLIVDPPNGRFPELTTEGQRRADSRREYLAEHPADSWLDRNTSDRCIVGFNAGPPITPLAYNQNMQFFQTPDHVVILTEMVHTARVVPLDGRPVLDEDVRLWTGDSRGYWEGDTLVVETTNFNAERRWIPLTSGGSGVSASENMTLVERFTRVDDDSLDYTYTVTDPNTWSRPFTSSQLMTRTEVPMFEYACHEGNYSMDGILAGARADERKAAEGQQ